jgi:hypothetical protein
MFIQGNNKNYVVTIISFPSVKNLIGTTDGQLSQEQYEFTLLYLIDFFEKINIKNSLRVQLHPVDNNLQFLKKQKIPYIKNDIEDVINDSDILIGINSTVIFQSMILNKPFILLNWFVNDLFLLEADDYPYISHSHADFYEVFISTLKFINYDDNLIKKNIEYVLPESLKIAVDIIKKYI